MVYFQEDCGTRFLDEIIEEGTPISKLLSLVDLIPVENHIRTKYYANHGRKFCFDVGLMIRLVVVKFFGISPLERLCIHLLQKIVNI